MHSVVKAAVLLGQNSTFEDFQKAQGVFLLSPDTAPFVVATVAIAVFGLVGLATAWIRHRERMAMIERGMHPDAPSEKPRPTSKPLAPGKEVEQGWADYRPPS
jgi:hypothetical protein